MTKIIMRRSNIKPIFSTQACKICNMRKSLSEFYWRKDSKRYRNECKSCLSESFKNRYKTNTDVIRARINKYKAEHYNEVLERQKKHRETKFAEISEAKKRCYKRNPEKYKTKNKAWRLNHPNEYQQINRNTRNIRRANKFAVNESNFTAKEFEVLKNTFNNKCFKCGSVKKLTVDHFRPLSKGFSLSLNNAIILCNSCNSSKCNKDPEIFFTKKQFNGAIKLMNLTTILVQQCH